MDRYRRRAKNARYLGARLQSGQLQHTVVWKVSQIRGLQGGRVFRRIGQFVERPVDLRFPLVPVSRRKGRVCQMSSDCDWKVDLFADGSDVDVRPDFIRFRVGRRLSSLRCFRPFRCCSDPDNFRRARSRRFFGLRSPAFAFSGHSCVRFFAGRLALESLQTTQTTSHEAYLILPNRT